MQREIGKEPGGLLRPKPRRNPVSPPNAHAVAEFDEEKVVAGAH
jgi:hypothetical protein